MFAKLCNLTSRGRRIAFLMFLLLPVFFQHAFAQTIRTDQMRSKISFPGLIALPMYSGHVAYVLNAKRGQILVRVTPARELEGHMVTQYEIQLIDPGTGRSTLLAKHSLSNFQLNHIRKYFEVPIYAADMV